MSSSLWASPRAAPRAHALLLVLSALQFIPGLVPVNAQIILQAAIAVYAGSWRSIKPEPPTETMTKNEAMKLPIFGSCCLLGLFLAFKFLPKWVVNVMIGAYMGVLGVMVMSGVLAPYLELLLPVHLREKELTFTLPSLPSFPFLSKKKEQTEKEIKEEKSEGQKIMVTYPMLMSLPISAAFCTWYILKKHWFANNALGIAFSLEGIEQLSLGSVQVGAILLGGLFFYDIFWVFCTPVMVSVAKNFDAPIKLLFPRPLTKAALSAALEAGLPTPSRPFSMLGLGDIVIPGIFVAMLLRYDVGTNFNSNYFISAFFGYVLGLGTTIFVMNVFNAAQPALLYIVPALLGTLAIHAWQRGELSKVWHYSEELSKGPSDKAEESASQPNGGVASKKDQ